MTRELKDKTILLAKTFNDNNDFLKYFASSICRKKVDKVSLLECTGFIDEKSNSYIDVTLIIDGVESIIRIEL